MTKYLTILFFIGIVIAGVGLAMMWDMNLNGSDTTYRTQYTIMGIIGFMIMFGSTLVQMYREK